jgi:tRNA(Arg) A34 adenosine deaminase TadA
MCLSACYWARLAEIIFAGSQADATAGGFDDAFLYQELALPPVQRKLPIRQLLATEGKTPFEAWRKFSGRVEY